MSDAGTAIDLHSHSTASDGEFAPAEVAARAAAGGLAVWALCDHDSVAGLPAAAEAAAAKGLRFVPGIELSVHLERREVHLLGHFVDPASPTLRGFEDLLAEKRRMRMGEIIAKLARLGVALQPEQVEKFSGGKMLGRPHVARALVETGLVATVKEAFDRFLGEGKPAYVGRYRLPAEDAIRMVHEAGGTATIAHPGVNRLEKPELARLARAGLDGLEIYHCDHNPSVRAKYLRCAGELSLVPTAGSDFHGPAITPDRRFGAVTMSPAELSALEARRP